MLLEYTNTFLVSAKRALALDKGSLLALDMMTLGDSWGDLATTLLT